VDPGETVLDLGSGAGFDLLVAAQKVGPVGHVIGVDTTDVMTEKARENAKRLSGVFPKILLSGEHSGFSVHVGETIPAANTPAQGSLLERMARSMTRPPIALGKVFRQRMDV